MILRKAGAACLSSYKVERTGHFGAWTASPIASRNTAMDRGIAYLADELRPERSQHLRLGSRDRAARTGQRHVKSLARSLCRRAFLFVATSA